MKIYLPAVMIVILLSVLCLAVAVAGETSGGSASAAATGFCPVSHDKISGKHFMMHEGKRYDFCCKGCLKKFKKNPAKYIAVHAH